jgi:prepilin-type N-terminal cleavage/methylation domain-containing protein
MPSSRCSTSGFSLIELLVAIAIATATCSVLFHFAAADQRMARAQSEAADLQQRMRVAADMIQRDLIMAGAGLAHGSDAGPLVNYLPPIVPARTGTRNPDPELAYFDDRVSIVFVDGGAPSAPLAADMPDANAAVPIDPGAPGCPSAGLCGFAKGTRTLLVDVSGAGAGFELFSVTDASSGLAHGDPDAAFSRPYSIATGRAFAVTQHVYYLDRSNRRLMLYDGYQSDVPLVENVVDLRFSYYIDPSSTSAPQPPAGTGNCVYGAGTPPTPLLIEFGGTLLRQASPSQFTDGPVCGIAPRRFDGDLLRLRRVRVTLRAQVGADDLRGTGIDFRQAGISRGGESSVPDLEVTFDVTPRNMRPTR